MTLPAAAVDLEVPGGMLDEGGRLERILRRFGIPAVVVDNDFHAAGRVVARLLCNQMFRPLCATTVDGILRWDPCELIPLAQALFDGYGHGVLLDGEWFGVDGAATNEAPLEQREAERTTVGRLAWTTTEQRDVLPIAARIAKQPLGVADVHDRRLVTPTLSRSDAQESPAWMVRNELLMWRDGDARGIASYANDELLVHDWDLKVQIVDPTRGWERDVDGNTVPYYLDHLVPSDTDAHDWTTRFKLDAERSEALRVLLRQRGSTEQTLSHAASVLGVSAQLAGVAEGSLDPQALPGYGIVLPASALQTIRAGLVDAFADDKGGPLLAWYRFSARHPRWRWVITALAVTFFTASLIMKFASQDMATLWIPILGLAVWCFDMALPRPRRRGAPNAQPDEDGSALRQV